MNRNVSLNNLQNRVTVAELNWSVSYSLFLTNNPGSKALTYFYSRGSPIPGDIPPPDIILAADCVYFEPAFPLLVQTLDDLSNQSTDVLFCYKKRRNVSATLSGTYLAYYESYAMMP